jgi:hypothetical protein
MRCAGSFGVWKARRDLGLTDVCEAATARNVDS